jgi:hypothetical protein
MMGITEYPEARIFPRPSHPATVECENRLCLSLSYKNTKPPSLPAVLYFHLRQINLSSLTQSIVNHAYR